MKNKNELLLFVMGLVSLGLSPLPAFAFWPVKPINCFTVQGKGGFYREKKHYCAYLNKEEFLLGSTMSCKNFKQIPADYIYDGMCNHADDRVLEQGNYRLESGTIIKSDGNGNYCAYHSWNNFVRLNSRRGWTSIYQVPKRMTCAGICS